jgi:DNA-binding transcriptional regulator LsrR (DeoR family)
MDHAAASWAGTTPDLRLMVALALALLLAAALGVAAGPSAALGVAVGAYVSDRLEAGQTVGIGWGRTLRWSVRSVRRRTVERLAIVSLLGGLGRGSEINTYETASRLADVLDAQCYYLAAPTFTSTPELRDMLLAQPGISEILDRGRQSSLALVGVGSLEPGSTMRGLGLLTDTEAQELAAAGAVGDLLGHFLAEDGRIVDHPMNRRVVALPPDDLRHVPLAILASGGPDKVGIVRGTLAGGYVNTVITDEVTAEALTAA